jgi:hypothetical protein
LSTQPIYVPLIIIIIINHFFFRQNNPDVLQSNRQAQENLQNFLQVTGFGLSSFSTPNLYQKVFLRDTNCVLCDVRIESLYKGRFFYRCPEHEGRLGMCRRITANVLCHKSLVLVATIKGRLCIM